MPTSHVLLASSLDRKGASATRAAGPGVALGLAVGAGSKNPKRWACEDSVAALLLEDGAVVACVADAHWGGGASEVVAGELERAWAAAGPGSPLVRLRRALHSIDGRMRARPADDPSETTALLAHRAGSTVTWVGAGDSALYVVAGGGCALRSHPDGFFLGRAPLSDAPALDKGVVELRPGELALLATDGLEPDTCPVTGPALAALLAAPGPLEDRVAALLARQSQAGLDNLGVVLLGGHGHLPGPAPSLARS